MRKNKLLLLLALLMTAVTGAWAQGPWTSGDCTVTLSDDVMTVSGTGAMEDYDDTNFTPWYGYTSDIETIVIESGVTSIGNFAFSRFEKLESVNIPASVTSIGNSAFGECGSEPTTPLTVSFAEGSTPLTIGEVAFRYANLKSIDIPNRVTSIGEHAFYSCSNLESVSIPASVTSISEGAFYNCNKLAKVYIFAPSLTTYSLMAFDDNADGRKIYVLSDAVDTYKAGWPAYAADIEAMTLYATSVKEGTVDADKWTISPNPAPEGSPVTIQYTGRLKVKGVKATSDEEPAEALPALSITSPSVGQIIGSDGKNYAYGSLPTGVTAVAKICNVSGSNGLALALTDEGYMDWSKAQTTCVAHTPAFTGGTWKLASNDEWDNMITAAGSYTALRDGFSSVGGTNMLSAGYWSSTESNAEGASFYFFDYGYWSEGYKDSEGNVARACLAFTFEAPAKEPATVTTAPTGAAIVGVGKTTALVSGGAAEGGTLWYAVTTTNTKPASTDGFSATVPTAEDIAASGKVYVWYYVKGDDTHSDSEIAATAIEVPVADIVWDATNVSNIEVYSTYMPYVMEGVTLSGKAENVYAVGCFFGEPTTDGIAFQTRESAGGFTFTAPTGKAFTKIEMKPIGPSGWDEAYEDEKLGTGWTYFDGDMSNPATVTWKRSAAASTVDLLTGAVDFHGAYISYIAFYLSE